MADPRRSGFAAARDETLRYHRELYSSTSLGEPGTWLRRPHPMVLDGVALLDHRRPVVIYDLGAGVGRHAVPIAGRVHPSSLIVAVDLLPEALQQLTENVGAASPVTVRPVVLDLTDFSFDEPANLVVAFSAIEHLPDVPAIQRLLGRAAAAVAPGGVAAMVMFVDRYEVCGDGHRRRALLESDLTAELAEHVLAEAFDGFAVLQQRRAPTRAAETRGADAYVLTGTFVELLAQRPG